jgi:hypothetical protein
MIGLLMMAHVVTAPLPPEFRGEWQVTKSQCGQEHEDMLKVSGTALRFYEARFAPHEVRNLSRSGLSMTGVWREDGGDGDTKASLRVRLSADKRRMTIKSPWWTSKLVRCS